MQVTLISLEKQINNQLRSKNIESRSNGLVLGATLLQSPGYVLNYNEELGSETYRKVLLTASGDYWETSCPVMLLMGKNNWRVWVLGRDELFIGYDGQATAENKWWNELRAKMQNYESKIPVMFGDLVVFRRGKAIEWDELELRRELLNFLVCRLRFSSDYDFLWQII